MAVSSKCTDAGPDEVRVVGPRKRETSDEEASELWRALVRAEWSVVDHTDADGKRVLLAVRNRPNSVTGRALLPRESHVAAFAARGRSNKHIAFELDLAPTTVASHLHSALAKLRLRSRRELIQLFGPFCCPPR